MPEYIVGADEIVGDDGYDDDGDVEGLLGALPLARLVKNRGLARRPGGFAQRVQRASAPPRNAVVVQTAEPRNAQEMVLGIQSASTVAAGASEVITFRPQVLFRATRLIVPDIIAPYFTIDDIKIGNASQFAASGAVPASAFGEAVNASGKPNLVMKTAQVSQDIVMTVTNRSGAAAQFRAALFGDSVF